MTKSPSYDLVNPANLVTFFRIALLGLLPIVLQVNVIGLRIAAIVTIPILFSLDSLDGYLARRLRCATKLGAVLDVVGDRIVENVFWLLLAYFRVIPVWIPVLVLMRGFITDGFRSAAAAKGHSTFSMMKSKTGWWLVASPASRTSYAILKSLVFTLGSMIWAFQLTDSGLLVSAFYLLLILTLLQCLLRGIFAIKECMPFLR